MSANSEQAVQKANELVLRYKTRDPFVIAKALAVSVRYNDGFKQLKGMYSVIARNRFVFLNANNSDEVNRIVCAHELGHDQLHREAVRNGVLQELSYR